MASLLGGQRPAELGSRPRAAAPARQELRTIKSAARSNRLVAQSSRNPSTPPDAPKDDNKSGSREWFDTILSRFGPVKEKTQSPTVLDFEKPLLELDKRIKEVRSWGSLWHAA